MSGKRYKDNNDDINDKKNKINREREDKYKLKIDDENDNIENKRIAYKKRAYSVIEEQSIHHDDNYKRDNNYKEKVSEKKLESDCEKDIDTDNLTKKRKNKYGLKYEDYTRPKHKALKVIGTIIIIIIVIIIAAGCAGMGFLKSKLSKMNYKEIDKNSVGISDTTKDEMKDYTNIALLGLDSRYDTYDTDYRTDCIMIATINNTTNDVTLWSIYRDTYVQMDLDGKTILNKINQAYYDGVQNTLKTINENLDLNITQYATVDFNAVRDLVNEVNGVSINITSNELKYINNYIDDVSKVTNGKTKHLTTPGIQNLDGIQAVAYCRIRYDGKDYKRTERMRTVLEKVVDKIKKMNVSQINELLNNMLPKVETNLTQGDITALIPKALSLNLKESFGWPYETVGVTINNDFYGPAKTLETNVEKLHKEVFNQSNYIVPDSVKEISDKIIEKTGVGK